MAYSDLRDFIRALEKHNELKKISFEVDPVLEIAEFADRAVKARWPGAAVRKAQGSQVSGSDQRLRQYAPHGAGPRGEIRWMRSPPGYPSISRCACPRACIGKLKMLPKLADGKSFGARKSLLAGVDRLNPCPQGLIPVAAAGMRTALPGVLGWRTSTCQDRSLRDLRHRHEHTCWPIRSICSVRTSRCSGS